MYSIKTATVFILWSLSIYWLALGRTLLWKTVLWWVLLHVYACKSFQSFFVFFLFLFDKVHKFLLHSNLLTSCFYDSCSSSFWIAGFRQFLLLNHKSKLDLWCYICYLMSNQKFPFLTNRRLYKENSSYAKNVIKK